MCCILVIAIKFFGYAHFSQVCLDYTVCFHCFFSVECYSCNQVGNLSMDIFQLNNCMYEHFQEGENVVTAVLVICVNFGTHIVLVYRGQDCR